MSSLREIGKIRIEAVGALCVLMVVGTVPVSQRAFDPPVAEAAMKGDLETVRTLLKNGADVNAAQGDGMTALHWSAERGDVPMTETLIYAGANVASVTRIGDYTPLHLASKAGHAPIVAILVKSGSDPNAVTTTGAVTPLHFAAASGTAEAITVLLDHGADVNATESRWEQTPLMFAAAGNRVAAVRVLLAHGADVTRMTRVIEIPEQENADREAGQRRDEVLKAFRAQAAPNDEAWRPSPSQVQAAVRAARLTPQAADETAQRDRVDTAFRAELGPDADSTQVPGQRGPARESGDAPEDSVPQQRAAAAESPGGYGDMVGGQGGFTALLHAIREGNTESTLALLEAGADIDQPTGGDRTTPLIMAMINGHFDLGLQLLELGADPNLANDAGTTPLYAALNTHWAPKARYPQQQAYQQQKATYLEVMRALLEAGADPNARLEKHLWYMSYTFDLLGVDTRGATPFWRAAYATDVDAMKLLVANGADPNVATRKAPERRFRRRRGPQEDHSGVPPVPVGGPAVYAIHAASGVGYGEGYAGNAHRHVPDGWLPAVKYLVEELGADVNARDDNGYTALHHAAARGDNELIRYLVDMGAEVTVVSRRGQTTVDMANGPVQRIQPFPETIALLESLGAKNNHNCVSC